MTQVDDVDTVPIATKILKRLRLLGGGEENDKDDPLQTFSLRDSPDYDLSRGTRVAIVLNHREFTRKDLARRDGTEVDCRSIAETFGGRRLGFECVVHNDLTVEEIKDKLRDLREVPADHISCLALFVLTHGDEGRLLHAKDRSYKLQDLIDKLTPDKCPNLAGKPKLLFVQACQGRKTDKGVSVVATDGPSSSASSSFRIPNMADFLVMQAAYDGHYAFRNPSHGSWLIQALCQTLEESRQDDCLLSVLTVVKRVVALRESQTPLDKELHKKKQIPTVQDTLIRKVYLLKGK